VEAAKLCEALGEYWVSVSIYFPIKTLLSYNAVGLTWDAHTPLCKTKTKHDLK